LKRKNTPINETGIHLQFNHTEIEQELIHA
jgi:hypothetical protein